MELAYLIGYLPFLVPLIVFPIVIRHEIKRNLTLGNSATFAKGAGIFKAALITLLILGVDLYILRPFGILPSYDMLGIVHWLVAVIVGVGAVLALVINLLSE